MGFIKEFKEFAVKGNVMDMAVGVIIGGAFGKIVSSLVDDVLMPAIGMLTGNVDFNGLVCKIGDGEGAAVLKYGTFIQNVIDFLKKESTIDKWLEHVYALVDESVERYMKRSFTDLIVCFGCTGGQHRSVYCAEHLASHLSERYDIKITVSHRELDIEKIL